MIRLLYFARLREALGSAGEELAVAGGITVEALMQQLAARGGVWAEEFAGDKSLRAAVNQTLAPVTAEIRDGDEVAFFPPVTGG
ncbi:molybdopterin converting factor subunit 1 [Methylovorus menthalis]|uniref:molybdopterin converting factor subunit 1 n=1 Tax=Methylovorus menthalis TaxID=1002227 RepID=UPI001E28856E|nr:molybdopterin converting factor subunit 1 [Methylovorus menthalis]MCB4811445.1 molybdopterin converting factor subunit 1 [Methylovorus menthalis]